MTESNASNAKGSEPTMKRYPSLAIAGIALAMAGFVIGRAYPAHDYHQIGTSSYLYDTHTGKLCAPFRASEDAYKKAALPPGVQPGSPLASALGATTQNDPWGGARQATRHLRSSSQLTQNRHRYDSVLRQRVASHADKKPTCEMPHTWAVVSAGCFILAGACAARPDSAHPAMNFLAI